MVAFTSLPNETLEVIFSLLSPSSLLSTRLSCKIFNQLVVDSIVLQYHVALKAAQAEDNPCSNAGLTPHDKLHLLKSRERSWAFLKPDFEVRIPANPRSSGLYDVTSGIYVLGHPKRTGIDWLKLPQKPGTVEWKEFTVNRHIFDIALCLDQHDLVAFLCRSLRPECEDLEILLLEFSTGRPHPIPSQSITIPMDYKSKPTVAMHVAGTHLILVLSFSQEPSTSFDSVFIYDWTKASLISHMRVPEGAWSCVAFLTTHIFLLPNASSGTFDVYRILEGAGKGPPQPIIYLALPEIQEGIQVQFDCRGEPNPTRGRPKFAEAPFRYKSEDAVVVFFLQFFAAPDELRGDYFIFLHRRALLEICDAATSPPARIPWTSWGPPVTRWLDSVEYPTKWITITCGQRAAIFSIIRRESTYSILDFNPENIRKMKAWLAYLNAEFKDGRGDGADLGRISVIDAEVAVCSGNGVFKYGPVLSSLPFVMTTSEEEYNWDGIILDDQRVIGFWASDSGIKELQVLHFG